MMIPAMDAVTAERIGYLTNDGVQIAAVMYDEAVEERNNGSAWKKSRPMSIVTEGPVDITSIIQDPTEFNKHNFSQEFWEECAKVYRFASQHEEQEENEEIIFENIPSDFEVKFLNSIIGVCERGEGFTHDVWNNIIQDSEWEHIEDNKTGDVTLTEESDREFKESTFTDQNYIPDPSEVDEWGLYDYSYSNEHIDSHTIWVRLKQADDIVEYPLVYDTDGCMFIVSSSPDFGAFCSNHISPDVQEALEKSQVIDDLTKCVSDTKLCSKTEKYILNATDSQIVKP